ncbi:MAG: hypothetical protein HQL70_10700 [Magnetococcales bacterium]|nr:hypothetical protein [Magnetococcales bacterium]
MEFFFCFKRLAAFCAIPRLHLVRGGGRFQAQPIKWLLFFSMLFVVAPGKVEGANNRVLLERHLSLDLPDISITGKVSIFSLNPLTGQLAIKTADGDPRRIFELISESSGLLHGLSTKLPIKQIVIKDCLITMTSKGVEFNLKSADIPDGRIEDLSGFFSQKKVWEVSSGKFILNSFPFPGTEWEKIRKRADIFPLGFSSLVANGQQRVGKIEIKDVFTKVIQTKELKILFEEPNKEQFDISLDAKHIRVDEPRTITDATGLINDVMDYAGKAAQLGGILTFDRAMVRGVIRKTSHIKVNPLRLSAPDLQVWGTVEAKRRPEPGTIEIDLTAKRPGRAEESFHWQPEKK